MEADKFVDINRRDNIDSILKKLFKMQSKLQVWQKDNKLRLKTDSFLSSLDLSTSTIILKPEGTKGFEDFDGEEVYFYSPHRTTIFKSKIKKNDNGKSLTIEYPDVVKVEEARVCARKNYGLRSYQKVDIMLQTNKGKKLVLNDLRLLDTSEDGAAFLLDKATQIHLGPSTKFIVLTSTVEEIVKRAGVFRNITNFTNPLTGEKCLRVGVQLLTQAPVDEKE